MLNGDGSTPVNFNNGAYDTSDYIQGSPGESITMSRESGSYMIVRAYEFYNKDKVFKLVGDDGEDVNLNYETISISREVSFDGSNKYILNGSEVRLRDIHNLLSSVNIGSSGHHIISQGEADRILNANTKERKSMIEDALGLKIYQYKKQESEKKLIKTRENIAQTQSLRREIVPHIRFLKKQVEKVTVKVERSMFVISIPALFRTGEATVEVAS